MAMTASVMTRATAETRVAPKPKRMMPVRCPLERPQVAIPRRPRLAKKRYRFR